MVQLLRLEKSPRHHRRPTAGAVTFTRRAWRTSLAREDDRGRFGRAW